MLSPQDIANQAFQKAVFGGYDMASVDEFLDQIQEDYSALYKENAILKNKLKVLVEKVEEYRSTEDSMRVALITAQKMSKEMTDEAETKAKAIVEDAEGEARRRVEELRLGTRDEELKLEKAKAKTAEFINEVSEKFRAHIGLLASIDVEPAPAPAEPEAPAEEPVDAVEETAKSIEDSLARILSQEAPAEDLHDTKPVVLDPESGRFKDLQFGSNYDK
jgi:cell division initiation protein